MAAECCDLTTTQSPVAIVRLDRIEPQLRGRDSREVPDVFGAHYLRLAKDRIAESDIDTQALSVDLAREPRLRADRIQ